MLCCYLDFASFGGLIWCFGNKGGWRDGSGIKNTGWSFRGPRFGFQYPHDTWLIFMNNSNLGDLTFFWSPVALHVHSTLTYTWTKHSYIKKIKFKIKKKWCKFKTHGLFSSIASSDLDCCYCFCLFPLILTGFSFVYCRIPEFLSGYSSWYAVLLLFWWRTSRAARGSFIQTSYKKLRLYWLFHHCRFYFVAIPAAERVLRS